jgi:hypothetical protein
MNRHTAVVSEYHQFDEFGPSLHEVHNFEVDFRIPANHSLLQIRSRSRGGIFGGVYWEHEEYDSSGLLIARYESFEELIPGGVRRSGWRKCDDTGRLLEEKEVLA